MLANDLNFGRRQRIIIKKSFSSDVLLTPLSFPSYLQYSMTCPSNFAFIQHSIICEKHLPQYIFALLEANKMFLQNCYPSKSGYHSKRAHYISLGTKILKFYGNTKSINNNSKSIHNRSTSKVSIVTSMLLNCSLKMRKFYPMQKIST